MAFTELAGYSTALPSLAVHKNQLFVSTSDAVAYHLHRAHIVPVSGGWFFDNIITVEVANRTNGDDAFTDIDTENASVNATVWYGSSQEGAMWLQAFDAISMQPYGKPLLVAGTHLNQFYVTASPLGDAHSYYALDNYQLFLRLYNGTNHQLETPFQVGTVIPDSSISNNLYSYYFGVSSIGDNSVLSYTKYSDRNYCYYQVVNAYGNALTGEVFTELHASIPDGKLRVNTIIVNGEVITTEMERAYYTQTGILWARRFDLSSNVPLSSKTLLMKGLNFYASYCLFPIYGDSFATVAQYQMPTYWGLVPYDSSMTPLLISPIDVSSSFATSISCILLNGTLMALSYYDEDNGDYSINIIPIPPIVTVDGQTVQEIDGSVTYLLSFNEDQSFKLSTIAVTHSLENTAKVTFSASDSLAGSIAFETQPSNISSPFSWNARAGFFEMTGPLTDINNLPLWFKPSPNYDRSFELTVNVYIDNGRFPLLFSIAAHPEYDPPKFPNLLPTTITLYRDTQPYLENIIPDNPDDNPLWLNVTDSFPEGIVYDIQQDRITLYGIPTGSAFGDYIVTFSANDGIQLVNWTRTYTVLYSSSTMFHPDMPDNLHWYNSSPFNESLPALLSPNRQTYMLPTFESHVGWLHDQPIEIYEDNNQIRLTGQITVPVGVYLTNLSVTYGVQAQYRSITINVLDSPTQVLDLKQGYTSTDGYFSIAYVLRDPDPNQELICEIDPRNPEVNQYITTHQKIVSDLKWPSAVDCQVNVENLPYGLYSWDMGSRSGNSVSIAINVEEPIPFHRTPVGIATIAVITGLISPLLMWRLKLGCENPGRQRDYFLAEAKENDQDLKVARAIAVDVLFHSRGKTKEHICLPLPNNPLKTKGCFGRFDTGNGQAWDESLIQVISELNQRLGENQQLSVTKLHHTDNAHKLPLLRNRLRHIIKHQFRCRKTLALASCGIFAEITAHNIRDNAGDIATLLYNDLRKTDPDFFNSLTESADTKASTKYKHDQGIFSDTPNVELGKLGN